MTKTLAAAAGLAAAMAVASAMAQQGGWYGLGPGRANRSSGVHNGVDNPRSRQYAKRYV
jgi:hypothetical protein